MNSSTNVQEVAGNAHDILSSITSVFIVLDNDGRVLQWNEAAEKVFGIRAAEALTRRLLDLSLNWDSRQIEAMLVTCETNPRGTAQREVRIERSGRTLSFAFMASPLRRSTPVVRLGHLLMLQGGVSAEAVAKGLELQLLGDERPLGHILRDYGHVAERELETALEEQRRLQREKGEGIILLGVDLTERRALEHQVAHNQKLEAIGQLAAGIAHEINTPTQFIGDNLRFLQDSYTDVLNVIAAGKRVAELVKEGIDARAAADTLLEVIDEVDLEYLQTEIPTAITQSLEGNARIAMIVRAMKEFSHPGTDGFTMVDINHAIESTITVARNEYKYVAEVVTELDTKLPMVPCLPGELNQVFLNLLVNAAHAIQEKLGGNGDKGLITVRTRQLGDYVEIEFEDTGSGIPAHAQPRVFDPFFTTKEVGKGTGQGLSIAHTVVVEKHKGLITFDTTVGVGTNFRIRLPLHQPETSETERV